MADGDLIRAALDGITAEYGEGTGDEERELDYLLDCIATLRARLSAAEQARDRARHGEVQLTDEVERLKDAAETMRERAITAERVETNLKAMLARAVGAREAAEQALRDILDLLPSGEYSHAVAHIARAALAGRGDAGFTCATNGFLKRGATIEAGPLDTPSLPDGISRCGQLGYHVYMAGPCFDRLSQAVTYKASLDAEGVTWRPQ